MTDLRPGDCVVCVDASPHIAKPDEAPSLVLGEKYTLTEVYGDPAGVRINGFDQRWGWLASRFRKVQKHLSQQDIKAWVNQPTDYEQPKAPVKERVK